MPLIVDHDARRQELAQVVARIIASEGLDAVTVRSTAEAAGFSTRVVSHYFAGKRELLLYCFRFTARRAEGRLLREVERNPRDLYAAIASLLPYNPEAREEWLVWVAFWGVAIADAEFSEIQRLQFSRSTALIASYLAPAIDGETEPETIARELLSALIGVAVQASYNPGEWSAARQKSLMSGLLDRFKISSQ